MVLTETRNKGCRRENAWSETIGLRFGSPVPEILLASYG